MDKALESKNLGDLLVAHGDRLWEAEREIAARLSSRVRLLVTLSTTLVGGQAVGLLKAMSDFEKQDLGFWLRFAIAGLLATFAGFTTWKLLETLVFLLYSLRRPVEADKLHQQDQQKINDGDQPDSVLPQTASYQLDLPDEFLEWSEKHASEPEAIVFAQIARASVDLRRRNLRKQYRIRAAERSFAWGVRGTLVFVLALLGIFALLFVLR